jgi:hypothetical protein
MEVYQKPAGGKAEEVVLGAEVARACAWLQSPWGFPFKALTKLFGGTPRSTGYFRV